MMRAFLFILCVSLTMPLAACGHKGGLKTPSQMEKAEAKKAATKQPEESKAE